MPRARALVTSSLARFCCGGEIDGHSSARDQHVAERVILHLAGKNQLLPWHRLKMHYLIQNSAPPEEKLRWQEALKRAMPHARNHPTGNPHFDRYTGGPGGQKSTLTNESGKKGPESPEPPTFANQNASTPETRATCSRKTRISAPKTSTRFPTKTRGPRPPEPDPCQGHAERLPLPLPAAPSCPSS